MSKIKVSHQCPDKGDCYSIVINGEHYSAAKHSSFYGSYYCSDKHERSSKIAVLEFVAKKIADAFGFDIDRIGEVVEENNWPGRFLADYSSYLSVWFKHRETNFIFQQDRLPFVSLENKENFFSFVNLLVEKFKEEIEMAKRTSNFEEREIEIGEIKCLN